MTSNFDLCAPRMIVLLKQYGLESLLMRFDGWEVTAGGRSRLIRQTEVDRLVRDDDYEAIEGLVRSIALDLTVGRSTARKRRAFRTRQRSIRARQT